MCRRFNLEIMKRLIQIRGNNGAGKTTAVKQYCILNNLKTIRNDKLGIRLTVKGKECCFIGEYTESSNKCCGLDSEIHNRERLFNTVGELLTEYETVVFESAFYGKTFDLANRLNNYCKKNNIIFEIVLFKNSFDNCLEKIISRNGNIPNINRLFTNGKAVNTSFLRLKKLGIKSKEFNIEQFQKEDMYKIVEEILR